MPRLHGAVGLAKSEKPPCTGNPQPRLAPSQTSSASLMPQAPLQGWVGHQPLEPLLHGTQGTPT